MKSYDIQRTISHIERNSFMVGSGTHKDYVCCLGAFTGLSSWVEDSTNAYCYWQLIAEAANEEEIIHTWEINQNQNQNQIQNQRIRIRIRIRISIINWIREAESDLIDGLDCLSSDIPIASAKGLYWLGSHCFWLYHHRWLHSDKYSQNWDIPIASAKGLYWLGSHFFCPPSHPETSNRFLFRTGAKFSFSILWFK